MRLEEIDTPPQRIVVHLKGYDFVKVLRIVSKNEDTQYWATDVLDMNESEREDRGKKSWKIEEYHRGIKQFCGVENARQEKRVTESTCNIIIESFSKAGSTKNQKRYILV